MKVLMCLLLCVFTQQSYAYELQQLTTSDLVCAWSSTGVGCVSNVSMEKDKLQVEVLKLEKEKLLLELESLKMKRSNVGSKKK